MMNRSRCPAWVVLGFVVVSAGCGTSSAVNALTDEGILGAGVPF
jgi:hypothetical protein